MLWPLSRRQQLVPHVCILCVFLVLGCVTSGWISGSFIQSDRLPALILRHELNYMCMCMISNMLRFDKINVSSWWCFCVNDRQLRGTSSTCCGSWWRMVWRSWNFYRQCWSCSPPTQSYMMKSFPRYKNSFTNYLCIYCMPFSFVSTHGLRALQMPM